MTSDCPQVSNALIVPPHIESLKAYQAGRPAGQLMQNIGVKSVINMASNENPLGPPTSACEAMTLAATLCNRYPEFPAFTLCDKLAARYGVSPDNVAVGSGSSSIMDNIIRAFVTVGDEVVTAAGTFVGFFVIAQLTGARLRLVPLKDYHFDLTAIAGAITPCTRLVYLCNPNNPTGTIFSRSELEDFMKKVPENVLVIMDEAYVEYVQEGVDFPDSINLGYSNMLTLRSFSKAYGMAGIRLGYCIGAENVIRYVNKVKLPFEPSALAQAAGIAAINDDAFLYRTINNNNTSKKMVCEEFERMGVEYIPSQTNFVCVPYGSQERVKQVHESLLREGIAVRPLAAFGLPDCFRVTTGVPEECSKFIEAFRRVSEVAKQ